MSILIRDGTIVDIVPTGSKHPAGDAIVLRELAAAGARPRAASPRIFYSALMAGPTFFEDPRSRSAAHDGAPGQLAWLRAIDRESDIRAVITAARATGATGIKLY